MAVPESKTELLLLVEQEHALLDRWVAGVDEAALARPGIAVGWAAEAVAIKDILVHITWWEKRMLARLKEMQELKMSRDFRFALDKDDFNCHVYMHNLDHAASDVLHEYRSSYQSVIRSLKKLDEETLALLNTRSLIGSNTYNHYRWAVRKIRPWVRSLDFNAPIT